jgi:beta-lactamase superfamily II metal-dependent hydrolase
MALRIQVHNVGQGHAVHVFTPSGQTIVIDLGGSTEYSPLEFLRSQTDTIDSLIVTHPHGDHIEEFESLANLKFKVRQFWRPKWLTKDEILKQNQQTYVDRLNAYQKMSEGYNEKIADTELVGNPSVSGGVRVRTFASSSLSHSNINNHSGVTVLEYHGAKVVIPGDNESPSWNELLKQPEFVEAISGVTVFLASHHGRESGYCPDIFISKPKLCIVSDGPVKDTDATANYSYHAEGWDIVSRNTNKTINRNCITTRSDGHVDMQIGKSGEGAYLAVQID